jgi:PKD-like domain
MVTFPNATPPPYKFIATSQGSQCGTPVFAPYKSLVSGSGFGGYDVLFGLSGRKYVFNLQLNALPEYGQVKEITHLTLKGRKKIFFINTPYLTLLSIKRNSPPNMYPIDGVAGSIQDFERSGLPSVIPQSYGGFTAIWLADLFYFFSGLNFQPSFTFISTTSALDGANSSTFNLPYIFAANGQNGSHAETYIAQEPRIASGVTLYNIAHTDFTARNSEWIFNEMENRQNTTGCEQLDCNAPAIAPLTTICPGNKTYHIANNNSTQPVTWSIEPQGIVTLVSQGNAIQVIRGEATNDVTLTAQFINGCGQQQSSSFTITDVRPIYGLPGTPGISINDASAWCPGTTRTFTIPVYAPGLTYNWQVGSGSLSIVSALPHTNSVKVLYSGGTRGAETVSVSGYSTCDRLMLYEYAASNFADVITGTVTSSNGYNNQLNTINLVEDNNALITVDVATGNQLTYTLTGGLPQAWGAYVDEPNTMFVYNQNGGNFDFNVSTSNSNCNTITDKPFTIRLVSQPGTYNPAFVISPNPVVNSTKVALSTRAATRRYVTQCLQAGGYVSVKVMSSSTGTQVLPTINGLAGTTSVRVDMSSLTTGQVYLFIINATGCSSGVYQEVQQVLH